MPGSSPIHFNPTSTLQHGTPDKSLLIKSNKISFSDSIENLLSHGLAGKEREMYMNLPVKLTCFEFIFHVMRDRACLHRTMHAEMSNCGPSRTRANIRIIKPGHPEASARPLNIGRTRTTRRGQIIPVLKRDEER